MVLLLIIDVGDYALDIRPAHTECPESPLPGELISKRFADPLRGAPLDDSHQLGKSQRGGRLDQHVDVVGNTSNGDWSCFQLAGDPCEIGVDSGSQVIVE